MLCYWYGGRTVGKGVAVFRVQSFDQQASLFVPSNSFGEWLES